jgi:hypothetical protein
MQQHFSAKSILSARVSMPAKGGMKIGNCQPKQQRDRHRRRNGNNAGAALPQKTPILSFCSIHLGNLKHREYGHIRVPLRPVSLRLHLSSLGCGLKG